MFDSDGLATPVDKSVDQSSQIALSGIKSVQMQRLVLLTQQQLKEIRAYTANETFKMRKLTNELFKEFAKVKSMREDVRTTNYQVGANQLDVEDLDGKKLCASIAKRTTQMEK